MPKILPAFTTYSNTTEIVHVDPDGGSANCDKCSGACIYTYVATDESGHAYNYCSLCVPSVGDFIRITTR